MAFDFPKHPNSDRENPFVGDDGTNPFSESTFADPESASNTDTNTDPNLYSGSSDVSGVTHAVDDFVQTMSHRGGRVFSLGLFGLLASLLGVAGVLSAIVMNAELQDASFAACASALFFGVACSWPAWIMARNDLKAMRLGAMDNRGRRATRIGWALGLTGTITTVLPIAYLIFEIARSVADEL